MPYRDKADKAAHNVAYRVTHREETRARDNARYAAISADPDRRLQRTIYQTFYDQRRLSALRESQREEVYGNG